MSSKSSMISRAMITILATLLVVACGSSSTGNTPADGTGGSSGGGSSGGQLSALERMFPVVEDGDFDTAGINQSFICIDDVDREYFELVFSADGKITMQDGSQLPYRVNKNKLEIDFPDGMGGPISYQHGYHTLAGKLVVGFVGAVGDATGSLTFACIASNHPYSDAVPDTTTVVCRASSVDDRGTSFNSSTTNRFTLEPGHYAQRYFSSRSYESSYSADGSFSVSLYDETYEHGTYLFDAQSGDFVMGFMKVDFKTPKVDLLVFYGETDGTTVFVDLADNRRGCTFE